MITRRRAGPRPVTGEGLYRFSAVRVTRRRSHPTRVAFSFPDLGGLRELGGARWNCSDGSFRMTSAEPNLKWLEDAGMGLDAEVRDVSEDIGALAVQGPSSRAILMEGADGAIQKLKYFRFVNTTFAGIPVQ